MKRTGNLIHKIAEISNLQLAFFKAQKGKATKIEVIKYRKNLDANLQVLQKQILSANIEIGNYHFFTIYDPKKRRICAASFSERILHHALMNICHPVFEKQQIFDSYATRKNKGTYAALHRAEYFQHKYSYYLKLDIRKYFDSIDHDVLLTLLHRKFKDPILLLIFKKIIESYQTQIGKGLPIGNLTSQYFANYYLSFTDRYVQHKLKTDAYVRYMDDMVLWSNSKFNLQESGKSVKIFLSEKLKLQLKTEILNTNNHGLTFLAYRILKYKTKLSNRSKKRFICKAQKYKQNLNANVWSESDYQKHILPLLAFTNYAETKKIRQRVFN